MPKTLPTSMQPKLPSIEDVRPVSRNDEVCLREIRKVLRKHNALGRFGLTLLHQHFGVRKDEVLLEVCDAKKRTLTIRPTKQNRLKGRKVLETSWRLDTGGALMQCSQICIPYPRYHGVDHIHTA